MKTTINMNRHNLARITAAAEILGTDRASVIRELMAYLTQDLPRFRHFFSSVHYQDRDLPENWKVFHITLSSGEYELFLDLRKLLKMSVSLLVATALDEYLETLLAAGTLQDQGDRNTAPAYSFFEKETFGCKMIIYSWGIPKRIPD